MAPLFTEAEANGRSRSPSKDPGSRTSVLDEERPQQSRKRKYLPPENSASYALLITLLRGKDAGKEFMLKEEVLNEAEMSGLSRTNLRPDKLPRAHGSVQASANMWYCGWNCMSSLVEKGLVVKWSSPAKYMITEQGYGLALECMTRSGLLANDHGLKWVPPLTTPGQKDKDKNSRSKSVSCLPPSGPQDSGTTQNCGDATNSKDVSTLGGRECDKHVLALDLDSEEELGIIPNAVENPVKWNKTQGNVQKNSEIGSHSQTMAAQSVSLGRGSILLGTGGGSNLSVAENQSSSGDGMCLPPLAYGERFKNAYDVIICLDNQEKFEMNGGERKASRFAEILRQQYHLTVELKRLPVGDVLWMARSKKDPNLEYVLDFILERKRVDDLWHSIKSKRFRDQKLRLLTCGLHKVFYLIEGDPDTQEAALNIKTAGYQTEIEEGFDVQRTVHWNGEGGTLQRYAHLTMAIRDRYDVEIGKDSFSVRPAMTFSQFRDQCSSSKELTVGGFFGSLLSQIHSVTEDVALAVLERYPTLPSLVEAYQWLEGSRRDQEMLLTSLVVKNRKISELVSKRVFDKIWL